MNDKDLRVIKTKKALTQSLYVLLEKEMFSNISVNKICKNAQIHRTTFYKHFYDKYELLHYLFKLTHNAYFAIDIKERLNNPFQILANTFNKDEISRIELKQHGDKEFEKARNNYLIETVKNEFKDNMHRIAIDNSVPPSLVFYVFGAVLTSFLEWKRNENATLSPKEMDEVFHKLINIKAK
ncbi:TetR family transcriptional regulator [Staphylococcus sp. NRL 16/872]|uniref:TetR family transcriptional regulator n=1 Tax=Staphylococcus sp. NRL 16/872 TaxID=2930131 RepID=UPI001FB3998C|nr:MULTISPECIES: TetR family transcriptional regulator [unclassified Staphylococcus]MCJ1655538.1 TetR/AcrR family transcriptional regulator [Staphylococcus sp. NRL 21/187]MCJ1661367.1 TetR/AcrR family transcriptional regulator [Staphylococcus sp. NRL 18/288]MCJ1667263.1 TetR/AcrR family transcriptional regulator [Staphylococcus sp. NRL 19/737]WEN69747.1 TetR family transcriptional regulator [Staphylococcus sp. NRL 16/872]